ncbi:hypothetical protein [Blastococcus sp. TF02A-26]|uniref:hypothetical protein n=1 Tax=Blastococcus sp. TF02A-26 TaxID=2250577 RepID=UPI000DE9BE91|nr:hypothetical protein [Blastococcus sp. TF02A-26]RBY82691.1 hypothetical protein DQ240_18530 [Blastococcus sp. TF02A-26]
MTIPVQRGPESDGTGRVLSLVVESLRRVEDSVGRLSADMRVELAKLPEQYIHRREADRRFDELSLAVREEEAERQRDVASAREQVTGLERRLVEGRRWVVGLACGSGLAGIGLIVNIMDKFQ